MWVVPSGDVSGQDVRDRASHGQGETGNRSRGQPGLWPWSVPQRELPAAPRSVATIFNKFTPNRLLDFGFWRVSAKWSPRHGYLSSETRYKHIPVFALSRTSCPLKVSEERYPYHGLGLVNSSIKSWMDPGPSPGWRGSEPGDLESINASLFRVPRFDQWSICVNPGIPFQAGIQRLYSVTRFGCDCISGRSP